MYRYSRWDGTQAVEPFTASDLMDYLADKILDEHDLRSALRELLQRGGDFQSGRHMPGLRDLLEQLRQRRQQQLGRYNLGSVMDDIKERLERIVETERSGIQRRLDEENPQGLDQSLKDMLERIANQHLNQLDQLPPGVGGKMQALRDYDFMDGEARQQFEELLNELKQQMMEQYFQGLKQSLGAMTPEMMSQLQQMVRDLNQLLEQHRGGDDSGFQDFMDKWGQYFPQGLENPEQLAQHLAHSMAQMQQLLDSMTPEMRQELEQMLEGLFQDGAFQRVLARLFDNLGRMFPEDFQGDPLPFAGDDPLTLKEAMRLMGDMQGLDELEQELLAAVKTNDSSKLDSGEIGRLVGEEARRMAEEIQEFTRMLEEAGFIQRKGKDWALTPRAMRRIGERALEDIFGRIDRGLSGEHTLSRYGWGIERLDETKQYTFGDAFALDAQGSIMNALRRRPDLPLHMTPDDFEVYRTSSINQCSTVIMVDMSYSMLYRGRFQAARKVALALDSLIRSKFPRDVLHVVAFSYFVLPLEPHMLLETHWIDPRGTDFPEALRQARNILGKRKGGTKQIIMITDGEPHANSAGWNVGPWSMREAMEDTLREVQRCSRDGITVNTFMLDSEPVMTRFVRTLTKINQGRVFFADPSQLGEYVIVDYVKNRRRAA